MPAAGAAASVEVNVLGVTINSGGRPGEPPWRLRSP
jgi:hypothetical protein